MANTKKVTDDSTTAEHTCATCGLPITDPAAGSAVWDQTGDAGEPHYYTHKSECDWDLQMRLKEQGVTTSSLGMDHHRLVSRTNPARCIGGRLADHMDTLEANYYAAKAKRLSQSPKVDA